MKEFHAHLYFDKETLNIAKKIIDLAANFDFIKVGTVHEKTIGPHPMWSCQLLFKTEHLNTILPWLMSNREGLKVFIHPLSGDELKDHTIHAMWLGEPVELDLSIFK